MSVVSCDFEVFASMRCAPENILPPTTEDIEALKIELDKIGQA
ncbi:MAG: hypothetical protein SXA11_05930 [Cyanobacteriota bacterium]|nr:hypothetical protein [Cyanobacteriota bacterium]